MVQASTVSAATERHLPMRDVVIVPGIQVAGDWGRVRAASTALTIALLSAPRCAAVFPPFYLFG
jgi:hypothetical protein